MAYARACGGLGWTRDSAVNGGSWPTGLLCLVLGPPQVFKTPSLVSEGLLFVKGPFFVRLADSIDMHRLLLRIQTRIG